MSEAPPGAPIRIRRQTTAAINQSGCLKITHPYVVQILAEQEGLQRDIVTCICDNRGPLRAGRFDLNATNELIYTTRQSIKIRTERGLGRKQNVNAEPRVAKLNVRRGDVRGISTSRA